MNPPEFTEAELKQRCAARFTHHEEVTQRYYTAGRGSESKFTIGLSNCFRVAVVGTIRGNQYGYDRFLAHVDDLEEPVLEGFISMIRSAKRRGLINLSAVVVHPIAKDEADREDFKDREAEIKDKLNGVLEGGEITLVSHEEDEYWQMTIEADKRIDCGPD